MTDLIVVGGGPAGLITAITAAKRGCHVVLFEEHTVIGRPDHCTGLLDIEGLKRLGLPTRDVPYVSNPIHGAIFHGYNDQSLRVRSQHPKAVVIDRSKFDAYLEQKAMVFDVKIYKGVRVTPHDLQWDQKEWHIRNMPAEIPAADQSAPLLVLAEGVRATLSQHLGFLPPRPIVPAIQTILHLDTPLQEVDMVHLYFDRKYADNFFAWQVPINSSAVKIGLATQQGSLRQRLTVFTKHLYPNSPDALAFTGHCVLTGGPLTEIVKDHVMIVGDTAGQVKPTTGGGVNMGGLCATWLGETAVKAIRRHDTRVEHLRSYQELCHQNLRKEMHTMLFARKLLNHVSDQSIARMIQEAQRYQELIETKGDIDFQASVINALIRKPRFLARGLWELTKDLFRSHNPIETVSSASTT